MKKQNIYALAEKAGCIIQDDGYAISMAAPDGKIFSLTDSVCTHSFVYGDGAWRKSDIYTELAEYINGGIV